MNLNPVLFGEEKLPTFFSVGYFLYFYSWKVFFFPFKKKDKLLDFLWDFWGLL